MEFISIVRYSYKVCRVLEPTAIWASISFAWWEIDEEPPFFQISLSCPNAVTEKFPFVAKPNRSNTGRNGTMFIIIGSTVQPFPIPRVFWMALIKAWKLVGVPQFKDCPCQPFPTRFKKIVLPHLSWLVFLHSILEDDSGLLTTQEKSRSTQLWRMRVRIAFCVVTDHVKSRFYISVNLSLLEIRLEFLLFDCEIHHCAL